MPDLHTIYTLIRRFGQSRRIIGFGYLDGTGMRTTLRSSSSRSTVGGATCRRPVCLCGASTRRRSVLADVSTLFRTMRTCGVSALRPVLVNHYIGRTADP